MIYQRSSTTFELISLDEGGSGSGINANTTVTVSDANIDWQRKISRKQKQRNSKATISSSSNINYKDAESDFENLSEKQSQFGQKKSNENDLSLTTIVYSTKKSRQQNLNNSNKKNQFENALHSNRPDTHLALKKLDQVQTNSFQQSDYSYEPNIINFCQINDTFDPITTTTTSISEMIADDYDNEDDNSFAIFKTIKNDTQYQNYYTNRFQQQKQNSKKKININFDENDENDEQNLLNEIQSCNNSIISDNLDKLEQYERDDQLGEMMPKDFGRKNRREGVVSLDRSSIADAWSTEDGDFLTTNYLNQQSVDFSSISENHTKSLEDEEMEKIHGLKKYAKLILPHVGLVVITCAYTLIGASIFYSVENPNEVMTKRRQLNMIYARQAKFVSSLIQLASSNQTLSRDNWAQLAHNHMNEMSDQLFIAFDKYFLTSNEVKRNTTKEIWTFSTALFFSVTVVTTIGYGNPVPVTQFGRMMCISFSLFGIPLTLVTIADMGKFLSERLIWAYGKYLRMKHFLCLRVVAAHRRQKVSVKDRRERVCDECHGRGISKHMQVIEEQRIPALLVFGILVLYTALGGVLMSHLEPWSFFTSFYWSFITMTTVGFGDLMPRREQYMYIILLYIILGLAITTMCIDLVGVQYIRKIHYFGRKIQDARSALAVVGGKVVLVSELYSNLMQKRARNGTRDTFVIDNLHVSKHIIPFIPSDIRFIQFIDQPERHHHKHYYQSTDRLSMTTVSSAQDLNSCRFCHSRFNISSKSLKS